MFTRPMSAKREGVTYGKITLCFPKRCDGGRCFVDGCERLGGQRHGESNSHRNAQGCGHGYTTVDCKAYAVLIPTTPGTVTLSGAGVLSWLYSADQSANAHAGFDYSTAGSSVTGIKPIQGSSAGTVTAFICAVHVPYTFTNAVGGQSMVVMYDVTASDNSPCVAGYCPFPPTYPGGHARQVMQIATPPADGGTIEVSAHPKL